MNYEKVPAVRKRLMILWFAEVGNILKGSDMLLFSFSSVFICFTVNLSVFIFFCFIVLNRFL